MISSVFICSFITLNWVVSSSHPICTLEYKTLSPEEQVIAQSIQGLENQNRPLVWLNTIGASEVLLKGMRMHGSSLQLTKDVWQLIQKFRPHIRGAILYRLGQPSLNVATSLCGPMHAIAIDESLQAKVKDLGIPILLDARDITEEQAYSRYYSLFAKGIVVEQSVTKPGNLRDFAIKHHAFVMDTADAEFRKKVVREAGPHALVFGWGRKESHWVADISEAGGTAVPADWCTNLSALETLHSKRLQPTHQAEVKLEPNVRYVAFVVSDGDNVQWLTNDFLTNPHFYASPLRGQFPITWEVSCLLSRFAPAVLETIYDQAKPTDDFVTGPGLPGYTFPHLQTDRTSLAKASKPYLRQSGLHFISILNQMQGNLSETDPWLDLPEVDGALYKDYSGYAHRHGELKWHNGKPCMAYRFLLIERPGRENEIAKEIGKMPTDPARNSGSYALINVHAWSFENTGGPAGAVKRVIDKLPPNTRVITASQLLRLLRRVHPTE